MYIGKVLEQLNLISKQDVKNKGCQFCTILNILDLIILFSFGDISLFSAALEFSLLLFKVSSRPFWPIYNTTYQPLHGLYLRVQEQTSTGKCLETMQRHSNTTTEFFSRYKDYYNKLQGQLGNIVKGRLDNRTFQISFDHRSLP